MFHLTVQLLSFIIYIVIIVVIFRYTNRNLRDLEVIIRNNPDTEGREGAFMNATDLNDRTPVHNTAADKSKMLKYNLFQINADMQQEFQSHHAVLHCSSNVGVVAGSAILAQLLLGC